MLKDLAFAVAAASFAIFLGGQSRAFPRCGSMMNCVSTAKASTYVHKHPQLHPCPALTPATGRWGIGLDTFEARSDLPTTPARRFPPPWTVNQTDACFIVKDHNGQGAGHSTRMPVRFLLRAGDAHTEVKNPRMPSGGYRGAGCLRSQCELPALFIRLVAPQSRFLTRWRV
jgi:hypothetical protein